MTARFGRDHAAKIAELLGDPERLHVYTVDPRVKADLRDALREQHGVWRGSLFPDSSAAAETAKRVAFPASNRRLQRTSARRRRSPSPRSRGAARRKATDSRRGGARR